MVDIFVHEVSVDALLFQSGSHTMSSIPPAVSQALAAQRDAGNQKIAIAVVRKQLDAQQAAGDAVNQLLEASVQAQRQIAKGHLDVKA